MGEARRRKLAGKGTPNLPQDEHGNYLINLRQTVFIVMKAAEDKKPSKPIVAISQFIDLLAEAVHGRKASDAKKIDLFVAWLKGNVKGETATVTMFMQHMAEKLHEAAPQAMDMFHFMARKEMEMER
jgi:hypothetical protein